MAVHGDLLFHRRDGIDLDSYLRHLQKQIPEVLRKLTDLDFSEKTEDEIKSIVVSELALEPLVVDYDAATANVTQTTMVWEDRIFGERSTIPALYATKSLPFSGNSEFWSLKTNPFDLNPPRGEVKGNQLVIGMTVPAQQPEGAETYIESTIAKLPEWIERHTKQIEEYNTSLPSKIIPYIESRKKELGNAADLLKKLKGN